MESTLLGMLFNIVKLQLPAIARNRTFSTLSQQQEEQQEQEENTRS